MATSRSDNLHWLKTAFPLALCNHNFSYCNEDLKKQTNNPGLFNLHFQEKLLKEQISVQLFFPLLKKKKSVRNPTPPCCWVIVNHLLFLDQTQHSCLWKHFPMNGILVSTKNKKWLKRDFNLFSNSMTKFL